MHLTKAPTLQPQEPSNLPCSPVHADANTPGGDAWQSCPLAGWRFQVRSGWRELFERHGPRDWLRLDGDDAAHLVKENDGRQVWRLSLGGRLVFVKLMLPGRRWQWLRRMVRGSDAERERRIAEFAASQEILTVVPVAVGHAPGGDTCLLITEGVPDASPLDEFWLRLDVRDPATRRVKNQVIDETARMLAHAHARDFEHLDLHAGNIVLRPSPEGAWQPLFVDLHNVRTGAPLGVAGAARNLARFNQWFQLRGTLTDRVRFLHRYVHWRERLAGETNAAPLEVDLRGLAAMIALAAADHAEALYSKRDRRALRSGRYFARLKLADGWRAHVYLSSKHASEHSRVSQLSFSEKEWRRWLADPLAWVDRSDRRQVIKDSVSATVCRKQLPLEQGPPLDVLCKRSLARNPLKRLQNLFRASRPMLTWRRAHALMHRQIPTARPLAVIERRRFGAVVDSILITEFLEDASDLDTVLTVRMRELGAGEQRALKAALIQRLSDLVRRMEQRRFDHRDFKAPNVMVQWDPARPAPPRFSLVDLDGLRRTRSHAPRLKMLARLNVSLDHCRRVTLTDRLRFLRAWLPARQRGDWKAVWRSITEISHLKRDGRARRQEKRLRDFGRV